MQPDPRRLVRSPALPILLLFIVALLDSARWARRWGLVMTGVLDEPAHLATAALVILAACGSGRLLRQRRLIGTALVVSVFIDVDHLPLYAGVTGIAAGGRPYSHSLSSVAVLMLLGLVCGRRARPFLVGAVLGVGLHLARDVASGPGVPLGWPLNPTNLLLPYSTYAAALIVLTGIAIGRRIRIDRSGGDLGQTRRGAPIADRLRPS